MVESLNCTSYDMFAIRIYNDLWEYMYWNVWNCKYHYSSITRLINKKFFKIIWLLRKSTHRHLGTCSMYSVNYILIRQKLCILGWNLEFYNTPWLCAKQGKCPPINIQNISHLHMYTYLHSWYCLDVKRNNLNYWLHPYHSYIKWWETKTKRRIGL